MFPASPPPLTGVVHIDVRVDRTRWHVATAGDQDAPPIVLIHGWPQHWWTWRKVIPELAKEHRVYAPDLRGFGWSDAPDGSYSKMGLACDVEKLLDELEVEQCHLVGHDWGGFVSFLTAIRAPERVSRLTALGIVHPWFVPEPNPKALLNSSYTLALAAPGLGTGVMRHAPRFIRTLLKAGVGPGFRWDAKDVALYADAYRRPEHARAASAVYRTFLTRELPAIARGRYENRRLEMPVVYATGEHDPVVTPARIEGTGDHIADLRTEVLEGAGHFLPEEQPQRVLDLLLDRSR